MIENGARSGFPSDDLEASMQNHPGLKYGSTIGVDYVDLGEGDEIDDLKRDVVVVGGANVVDSRYKGRGSNMLVMAQP